MVYHFSACCCGYPSLTMKTTEVIDGANYSNVLGFSLPARFDGGIAGV